MRTLERLILKKGEQRLAPHRLAANIYKSGCLKEYQAYLPKIEQCVQEATHWHGTGRYHYKHSDGTVYADVRDTPADTLEAIVIAGGLLPHFDPWLPSQGKFQATVSLSPVRMHSRAFARAHLFKSDSLSYELGPMEFWAPFYFFLLFVWAVQQPVVGIQTLMRVLLKVPTTKYIKNKVGTIRQPRNGKVYATDFLYGRNVWSDISGNYPILVGIAGDSIESFDVIPFTHKVEVRTTQKVVTQSFTHIEVPLDKVVDTEKLLQQNGLNLPVLPLEFVDLFYSNRPLRELAYV